MPLKTANNEDISPQDECDHALQCQSPNQPTSRRNKDRLAPRSIKPSGTNALHAFNTPNLVQIQTSRPVCEPALSTTARLIPFSGHLSNRFTMFSIPIRSSEPTSSPRVRHSW